MNARYYPLPRAILLTIAALIVIYLVVPLVLTVPFAFSADSFLRFPPSGYSTRWFEEIFADPRWLDAAGRSLMIALITCAISVPLGVSAAYALARLGGRVAGLIYGLMLSPMIVPVIVIALALYYAFARISFTGSLFAIAVAHSVVAVPLVVIATAAAMNRAPVSLELAAETMGASPLQAFTRVTLPLLLPGILVGAFLAFTTSFDELLIALFLGGVGNETLPRAMWHAASVEVDPTISAISTILIALTILAFAGVTSFSAGSTRRNVKDGTN
jgi:ABC-type spermidine/putrescine transport system permease subunit II